MRKFAVYVTDPDRFFEAMGIGARNGELYKVYSEVRPVDQERFEERGLEAVELDGEPDFEHYQWNERKRSFEHKSLLMRMRGGKYGRWPCISE